MKPNEVVVEVDAGRRADLRDRRQEAASDARLWMVLNVVSVYATWTAPEWSQRVLAWAFVVISAVCFFTELRRERRLSQQLRDWPGGAS